MRRNINFAGSDVPFEANAGTTDLFEVLTGQNLFVVFGAYSGAKVKGTGADALKYAGIIDLYKKMAFVMHVQATAPDIPTMRGKMTINDYLEWISKYNLDDFTPKFTEEIAALWRANTKTHTETKNP